MAERRKGIQSWTCSVGSCAHTLGVRRGRPPGIWAPAPHHHSPHRGHEAGGRDSAPSGGIAPGHRPSPLVRYPHIKSALLWLLRSKQNNGANFITIIFNFVHYILGVCNLDQWSLQCSPQASGIFKRVICCNSHDMYAYNYCRSDHSCQINVQPTSVIMALSQFEIGCKKF